MKKLPDKISRLQRCFQRGVNFAIRKKVPPKQLEHSFIFKRFFIIAQIKNFSLNFHQFKPKNFLLFPRTEYLLNMHQKFRALVRCHVHVGIKLVNRFHCALTESRFLFPAPLVRLPIYEKSHNFESFSQVAFIFLCVLLLYFFRTLYFFISSLFSLGMRCVDNHVRFTWEK